MYLIPHVLGRPSNEEDTHHDCALLQAVEQELRNGAPHIEDARQEKQRSTQHNKHSVPQSSDRVSPGFRCPCH
jgi:hypothetical protein